jgi:NTP pyrophosphatase (non-canonical NTP hydrolase)
MTTQEMKEAILRKERYDFEDLRRIMEILRSKEGCVWDREQDHHSIRSSLIEEAYEVIEAIDKKDPLVVAMKEWIDAEYESGRQTALSNGEIEEKIEELSGGRFCRL